MNQAKRRFPAIAILLAAATMSAAVPRCGDAATPPADIAVNHLLFPEGTIFVGQALYFVDYVRSSVLRLDGSTAVPVWHQDGCGANGLLAISGGFLVACFDAATVVKISATGATLMTIRQDDRGQALEAPNDFAADRKGGVYISDSGAAGDLGKVFYLAPDGLLRAVATGISFANGIGVSPDGRMLYVAESPTGKLLAFPIASGGRLGPVREFIRLRDVLRAGPGGPVTPDSLRVDPQGNVFVALYFGGGVAIVSPAGRLLTMLDVPSEHHTNLAISPDGRSLYVTAIDDDPRVTYRGQIVRLANPLAR